MTDQKHNYSTISIKGLKDLLERSENNVIKALEELVSCKLEVDRIARAIILAQRRELEAQAKITREGGVD
jgi:hypothetical protein